MNRFSTTPVPGWLLALSLLLLVALVAFCYGFTPMGDENDLWWHLKAGKIIADNGGFPPQRDVFAYTSADVEWRNHEWLAEWAMYGVYSLFEDRQLGGFRAVILAKALVLAAAFLLVCHLSARRAGDAAVAAVVSLIAVGLSRFTVPPRPPVITYAFTALWLVLLYGAYGRYRQIGQRWARMAALPALMVLWANLHGGFAVGLVLVFLFAAGCAIDGLLQWLAEGRQGRLWDYDAIDMARGFGLCGAACLVATLFNPYGFKIYGMFSRVMGDANLLGAISELQPPPLGVNRELELMILAFIVVGSLACRRLPTAADYLILLFFLHQALFHARHLPLFAVTAAPILAWQARGVYDTLPASWRRLWRPAMAVLAVTMAIGMVALPRAGWYWPPLGRNQSALEKNVALLQGRAYYPEGFPEEVCDYLLAHDLPGRLFNEVNFAGYLIWRLSPEKYQVFTDNRFDIFGSQFWEQAEQIQNGATSQAGDPVWRELLDKWDVNLVIIDKFKPLNGLLQQSGQWKLAFVDSRGYFRLWVRNAPRETGKHG